MQNKKAVLSQRWPRDAPYVWLLLMALHRVGLESIFERLLDSPKFPHVPLGVGGWPLGYEERRCWANCPCNY